MSGDEGDLPYSRHYEGSNRARLNKGIKTVTQRESELAEGSEIWTSREEEERWLASGRVCI
jgi:hypothetical protein